MKIFALLLVVQVTAVQAQVASTMTLKITTTLTSQVTAVEQQALDTKAHHP